MGSAGSSLLLEVAQSLPAGGGYNSSSQVLASPNDFVNILNVK
jgi:hypothetical protein